MDSLITLDSLARKFLMRVDEPNLIPIDIVPDVYGAVTIQCRFALPGLKKLSQEHDVKIKISRSLLHKDLKVSLNSVAVKGPRSGAVRDYLYALFGVSSSEFLF